MVRIADLVTPERIVELKSTSKDDVLKEMVEVLASAPEVHDGDALLQAILDRESILSTGIGLGIAVPHAKIASVDNIVAALGKTKKGISYGALDDKPVNIVVMIGASDSQQSQYIRALARVTLLLKNETIRNAVVGAESPESMYDILKEY
ncbi:MAG: PTS sugar transporter subunit IIA [Planctomycetes bacterium]|nr:PTS sugar transporter subunit IIA [Planctomycetota bacterium]